MKIVIIGSGIAGLSTYLALRKHLSSAESDQLEHEIKLVEAHNISNYLFDTGSPADSSSTSETATSHIATGAAVGAEFNEPAFAPEAIGLAIGIAKNGLAVLSRLSSADEVGPTLLEDILKAGHAVTKWTLSNARGWTLATLDSVPGRTRTADDHKSDAKGQRQGTAWVDGNKIQTVMISRQAMWKILLNHVIRLAGSAVIKRKKVINVNLPSSDAVDLPKLIFEDGSTESADLVIGADGLRSVARKAMFSSSVNKEGETLLIGKSDPHSNQDYVTPQYEGLTGVGGFIPASLLTSTHHPPNTMSVVFGHNGFFGYGYITSATSPVEHAEPGNPGPVAVYWSTFSSPSTHVPLPDSRREHNAALEALLARHRSWRNPSIQAILDHAEHRGVDGYWPTYTTRPLPHWSKNGRIVLVGDAAHTLQPSSGQGASQAMEDAEGLAMMLAHYLKDVHRSNDPESEVAERSALTQALYKFEQLRMPRVKMIWDKSQRMSKMKADMGFVQEMIMYFFIWLMSKFHDGENERVIGYDLPKEVKESLQDSEV